MQSDDIFKYMKTSVEYLFPSINSWIIIQVIIVALLAKFVNDNDGIRNFKLSYKSALGIILTLSLSWVYLIIFMIAKFQKYQSSEIILLVEKINQNLGISDLTYKPPILFLVIMINLLCLGVLSNIDKKQSIFICKFWLKSKSVRNLSKSKKTLNSLILIFYTLCSFIFLRLSNSINGEFLGGDIRVYNKSSQYLEKVISNSWNSYPDSTGVYPIEKGAQFINLVEYLILRASDENSGLLQRIIIYLIYIISSFLMFKLLRIKFKVTLLMSIVGGLIYGYSPLFYNYVVFGWWYVALSYAFLPGFLLLLYKHYNNKSVNLNTKFFTIGFTIGFFVYSSNLYVLYFIIILLFFLAQALLNRAIFIKLTFLHLRLFAFFLLGTLVLNFNWIIPRLLFKNSYVSNDLSASIGQVDSNEWHTPFTGFGITMNNSFFYFPTNLSLTWIYLILFVILITGMKQMTNKDFKSKYFLFLTLALSILIGSFPKFFEMVISILNLPFRDVGRLVGMGYLVVVILTTIILDSINKKNILLGTLLVFLVTLSRSPYFEYGLESAKLPKQPGLTLRAVDLSVDIENLRYVEQKYDVKSKMISDIIFLPEKNFVSSTEFGPCFSPPYNSFPNYIFEKYAKPVRNPTLNSAKIANINYSSTNKISELQKTVENFNDSKNVKLFNYVVFRLDMLSLEELKLLQTIFDKGLTATSLSNTKIKTFVTQNQNCSGEEIKELVNLKDLDKELRSKLNPRIFTGLEKIQSPLSKNYVLNYSEDELLAILLTKEINIDFERYILSINNSTLNAALANNLTTSYQSLKILSRSLNEVILRAVFNNPNFIVQNLSTSNEVKLKKYNLNPEKFDEFFRRKIAKEADLMLTQYYIIDMTKFNSRATRSFQLLIDQNLFKPHKYIQPELFTTYFEYFDNIDISKSFNLPQIASPNWHGSFSVRFDGEKQFKGDLSNIQSTEITWSQNFKLSSEQDLKEIVCSRISPCFVEINFWFGHPYLSFISNVLSALGLLIVIALLWVKSKKEKT